MFRIILFLCLLCIMSPAWGQSWCANSPLNPTEQTICATPDLGWRDGQLEQAYGGVRHLPGVQSDQLGWIAVRNGCGWNGDCIRAAYDSRIAVLIGLASGGAGVDSKPVHLPAVGGPDWCSQGSLNAAEQTICAYPELGQMDLYMADLYYQVRHYPGIPADQQNWLASRNACHANYGCLYSAYSLRIEYFQAEFGVN